MKVKSYNWGDETTNHMGICLVDGNNKIMVWASEDDWELEGTYGSGRVYDTSPHCDKVAFALGEALYQMIGGYR